jgi:hypothetical protein
MRGFVEMLPLHVFATNPPYLASLIYVVVAFVLFALVKRFRSFRLWEVALLAGTAFLGSYAYRSAQDFLLVWLAVGIPRLVEWYRAVAPRGVPRLVWRMERSAKSVLCSPLFRFQPRLAFLLLALLPLAGFSKRTEGRDWPQSALDFIEREDIKGNFFANANDGAYLLWRRGPENAHCYVDTRGFFFPPSILEDSHIVSNAETCWETRLQRVLDRRTDWLLLRTGSALWPLMRGDIKPIHLDAQVVLLNANDVRRWLAEKALQASR